jgi:hypothetical protein
MVSLFNGSLTQPSPMERACKINEAKVLSFGEDLSEARKWLIWRDYFRR